MYRMYVHVMRLCIYASTLIHIPTHTIHIQENIHMYIYVHKYIPTQAGTCNITYAHTLDSLKGQSGQHGHDPNWSKEYPSLHWMEGYQNKLQIPMKLNYRNNNLRGMIGCWCFNYSEYSSIRHNWFREFFGVLAIWWIIWISFKMSRTVCHAICSAFTSNSLRVFPVVLRLLTR